MITCNCKLESKSLLHRVTQQGGGMLESGVLNGTKRAPGALAGLSILSRASHLSKTPSSSSRGPTGSLTGRIAGSSLFFLALSEDLKCQ